MLKRLFDLILSIVGVLILLPIFLIIGLLIKLTSKGDIIFKQIRVTKNGKEFKIFKFRTMEPNTEKQSQITVGDDNRITPIGKVLRKTKFDEMPQLFNIIFGDMSFVGPRPEVPKYVALYTKEQKEILTVRAGITDYASIYFSNENEILGKQKNPEKYYIEKIIPYKLKLNKKYIKEASIATDIKIIFLTIFKIVGLLDTNNFKEEN